MTEPDSGAPLHDGLWRANPALAQLLGLCPLLAMSHSVVTALALGLATLVVLLISSVMVALLRDHVTRDIRLPAWLLIISTSVVCVELMMQAFARPMYQALGLFLPLIASNSLILQRADTLASRRGVLHSAGDALAMGTGYLGALLALGALRELFGNGTLFAGMDMLFGAGAAGWTLAPFGGHGRLLILLLPPGAFLGAGLLIALRNAIDLRYAAHPDRAATRVTPGSKRVRITGKRP